MIKNMIMQFYNYRMTFQNIMVIQEWILCGLKNNIKINNSQFVVILVTKLETKKKQCGKCQGK